MIFIWICIILTVLMGIAGAVVLATYGGNRKTKIVGAAVCIVAALLLAGLLFWWLYWTESGERMQKTFDSNTSGGLYRTVEVYDIQGNLIKSYKGKFDVQEIQDGGVVKIKFDMDGKRHIIYSQTGTVLIDEEDK